MSNKISKKRNVPSILRKILEVDEYVTDQFVKTIENIELLKQLKIHNDVLEISAHGILWLAGWLAFIWIFGNKNLFQMQVNFYIGLLIDISLVAIIKAITRRRRPMKSNDLLEIGPDKYAFPSGHASRSTFITFFFTKVWSIPLIFMLSLVFWSTCVCISRALKRKHNLLDIIAGVLLGIIVGLFLQFIYLDSETCISLISWLTEEKLDGGEYHV